MEFHRNQKPFILEFKKIEDETSGVNPRANICHPFPCQFFAGPKDFECLVEKKLNVCFISPAEDDECCALDLTGKTRCPLQSVVSIGTKTFLCAEHYLEAVRQTKKINQLCRFACGFAASILDGQENPHCLDIDCGHHFYPFTKAD